MRILLKAFCIVGALGVAVAPAMPQSKSLPVEDDRSVIIIFKDGHQQTFRLADIARIEFSTPTSTATAASRARFLGVWRVGIGGGNSGTFLITLKRDGVAEKSEGSHSGTWTVVNGEARCRWDDGWTDVIRKVGGQWEKAAWAPGTSLDEPPSNVAKAEYTESN
jgi:hypothetical protein